MVKHWITMQKVASSSLLGVTFAMNRQYFSNIIGKSLHVRVFCSTEESNIIGKILSPHHSGSKNKLGQQTIYSTPEQFNLRHPSRVSNLSVNFFHSVTAYVFVPSVLGKNIPLAEFRMIVTETACWDIERKQPNFVMRTLLAALLSSMVCPLFLFLNLEGVVVHHSGHIAFQSKFIVQ